MAAKPKSTDETKAVGRMVLKITAPGGPRRRAGLRFGVAPVEVNPADLSEVQLEMLRADPKLRIEGGYIDVVSDPATAAAE